MSKQDQQALERNLLTKDELDAALKYPDSWLWGIEADEKNVLIKSRCFHYIQWFAENITTEWTQDKKTHETFATPEFHMELWDLCRDDKDTLCIVPRGFAKTTAVSKIYVIWALIFNMEPSILLIMPKDLGTTTVGEIRYELETNEKIRDIWGDLVPVSNKKDKVNQVWRQRTLQLLNGSMLETISRGQKIRGKRPTKIIVDDPQEIEDVENPEIARKFIVWFWTTVYNALNPQESSVLVLGTIMADNCFVNVLYVEAKMRDFAVVRYEAIKDFDTKGFDGELLWSDRWTKEMLEARYNKIGKEEFLQEFQHIPKPINANFVFRHRERMRKMPVVADTDSGIKFYRDPDEPHTWRYVCIGIDFAMGGVGNDYTVIEARNERGELLAMWRGWITQELVPPILDEMIKALVGDEMASVSITPETNSADLFMKESRAYRWFYRFTRSGQVLDKVTNKVRDKLGFRTGSNKPILIAALQSRLDDMDAPLLEVSEEQYIEINQYVRNENGEMGARSPYNDDTVIAGCLAFYTIDQGVAADAAEMFA